MVTAVMGSVGMLMKCMSELWRALSRLSGRCWIYELKGVAVKDLSISLHLPKHVRWLCFARVRFRIFGRSQASQKWTDAIYSLERVSAQL